MITPSFSLTATERVLPRMALDFTTGVLDSRVTVTRALNTATRINASGNIETVNANLPRFDYDPVTLAPKGLLIEEARTNVQYPSTPQSVTGLWAGVNSGTQTLSQPSPDGGNNATLVTSNGSTESGYRAALIFTGSTTYTWSAYVKRGTARYAYMRALCVSGTPAVDGAWFDIQNGVVATKGSGITSSSITPAANGFYRIVMTATTPAVVVNQLWDLRAGNSDGAQTSVNGETMTYFGSQVEVGAFATSYIPTTTLAVLRNADVVTMTGTNFSNWYNQSQGTFVVKFTPDGGLVSNANRVLTVSQAGGASRVADIYYLGTNWVTYNGTSTTTIGAASVTSTPQRIAVAYAASNYGYVLNGGTVATDASALVNSPTQMAIGHTANTNQLNGHMQTISFYPQRLTNAEIRAFSK
jgi:hypothetical protein